MGLCHLYYMGLQILPVQIVVGFLNFCFDKDEIQTGQHKEKQQ